MVPVLLIEDLASSGGFPSILRRRGYPTQQISQLSDDPESLPHVLSPGVVILRTGANLERAIRVIPEIRDRWPRSSIVVLAETARETDALAALSAGADEFYPLPIALQEFLLKLGRLAARQAGTVNGSRCLRFGEHSLSILGRQLSSGERAARLTPLEAELLAVLMRARGVPVKRDDLVASMSQGPGRTCSPRTIDSHISHLRTKLRRARLGLTVYSVYGAGYRVAEVG
jgi:DNA-binding response OmpR family regulator